MDQLIQLEDLHIGYQKSAYKKIIAGPINLGLTPGEFICMLGANGSGKTTLLKTICGVQKSIKGTVKIRDRQIGSYTAAELSKLMSLVLTDKVTIGNLNVYALVSLGRYPYTGWFGGLGEKDKKAIEWALEITHTSRFVNRQLGELSDGELQKVMIARALAQDTEIILLDEPTAHLDLPNRIEIFQLLRKLALETNKIILLSTHELDLALQTADKVWLIASKCNQRKNLNSSTDERDKSYNDQPKNKVISGVPEDLVLNGSFENAFSSTGLTFDKSTARFKLHTNFITSINLYGPEVEVYWTIRAIERMGFFVDNNQPSEIQIQIDQQNNTWSGMAKGKAFSVNTIEEVLKILRQLI